MLGVRRVVNTGGRGGLRISTGVPMTNHNAVKLAATKRVTLRTLRGAAACVDAAYFLSNVLSAAEPGMLRGWDDGVEDDDGG